MSCDSCEAWPILKEQLDFAIVYGDNGEERGNTFWLPGYTDEPAQGNGEVR